MKKKILLITVLFLSFLVNIDEVSAKKDTEDVSCTWELPYSGIYDNDTKIYTGPSKDTVIPATIEVNSKQNNWKYASWNGMTKKFSDKNLAKTISKEKKCPDYIKIKIKLNDNVSEAKADKLLRDKATVAGLSIPSVYQADYQFTTTGGNIYSTLSGDDCVTLYMPLKSQNGSVKKTPIKTYQDKVLGIWKKHINNDNTKLSNACGGDGDKYLNKDNYSDVNFATYVMGGYSSTEQKAANDLGISEECWNLRQASFESRKAAMKYINSLSSEFKGYSNKNDLLEVETYASLPINGGEVTQKNIEDEKAKLEEAEKAKEKQEELQKNSCLALCQTTITTSSTPVEECKKGLGYKKCYDALKKCKEKSNLDVKNDKINDDVNTCMKDEMGEEDFEKLQSRYATLMNNLDTHALRKAKVPSLNVKYRKNYKVECSDISYLHQFWVAIEIIAPILVIAFGSLDFAKSVIAGDEKKIKDSRTNFVKRLVAAILLILTFAIVSVLVNLTNNDDVKDTSLIKCIVDGE